MINYAFIQITISSTFPYHRDVGSISLPIPPRCVISCLKATHRKKRHTNSKTLNVTDISRQPTLSVPILTEQLEDEGQSAELELIISALTKTEENITCNITITPTFSNKANKYFTIYMSREVA